MAEPEGTGDEGVSASGRAVLLAAFVLFVTGFWAANTYIRNIPVAQRLDDKPQFGLWAALIGALGGFALAALVLFGSWLIGILRPARPIPQVWWSWVAVGLAIPTGLALIFVFNPGTIGNLDGELTNQTRPFTVLAALCLAPGLAAFLALRWVAMTEANWHGPGGHRLRLLIQLRAELRRLLATFGAFLTLLVIATGMRRRALLAIDPTMPVPPESVLLYGLFFAVLLGLFYAAAESALDRRARRLLHEFAPLPDPTDPAMADKLTRRTALATLAGIGGSWRSFETTVVIAAPLLTALIGIATST